MGRPRKNPQLAHVKFVTAKGTLYAYFNTGKTKADGKPIYSRLPSPSSVGFYDSYAAALGARTKQANAPFTVAGLADAYEDGPEFRRKAVNTQKLYRIALNRIRAELGKFPAERIALKHVREVVENRIEGNGARNAFLAVLGVIYTHGRVIGRITCENPGRDLKPYKIGSHEPWPDEALEAGLTAEHTRTRLAINLLFYTGQRIGDVVKMRWSDIRGDAIFMTQEKGKKRMRIPLASDLRGLLNVTPKRGITIIVNQHGQPMTSQVIRRELKEFGDSLGLVLVPHGLRKNAVNAFLLSGCSVAETAAITGQSYKIVEYYARQIDQHRLGDAAILKLENKRGTSKPFGKQGLRPAEKGVGS